ncbi:MAG: pyridoxamine 5'-phosphate oxidase family protein [Thiohalocapsa sp.]
MKALYHEGELAVQRRADESAMARMNGGAIADRIPGGANPFIAEQPMAVAGSLDRNGHVWASVLAGEPGFLRAGDDRTLVLDVSRPRAAGDDPLWENLRGDPRIGLLVIELATRRRLRINGRVRSTPEPPWVIDVEVAYPNCPKYIQRRHWTRPTDPVPRATGASRRGSILTPEHRTWIAGADTLFVASAHPKRGIDASHRGGKPGFVQMPDANTLRIPDYSGNSMFNTLGNFASYPHTGVTLVDFERGRVLQLSGRPEILWDADDPRGETGGTGRCWQFAIEAWQESTLPFALDWELLDYSPFIPQPREAATASAAPLKLQVEQIRQETARIKRFRLRPSDATELPPFEPGAHLPLTVRLPNGEWAQRHYSILSDPDDRTHYEIAVLAEPSGRGGSLYLHEKVAVGHELEALPPRNEFPLADSAEHSILIAGGIGITPILCMLRALDANGSSLELHYSAQRESDLAFRDRVEALAGKRAQFYASREPAGRRIDFEGLLSLPAEGVHVYVCGPRRMIVAVREIAEIKGWPAGQIHFESFGAGPVPGDTEVSVTLARSGMTLCVPASRTILDTLLDAGYAVPHDCKRGECSMCATRVLGGLPDHRDLCLSPTERANSMCVRLARPGRAPGAGSLIAVVQHRRKPNSPLHWRTIG